MVNERLKSSLRFTGKKKKTIYIMNLTIALLNDSDLHAQVCVTVTVTTKVRRAATSRRSVPLYSVFDWTT